MVFLLVLRVNISNGSSHFWIRIGLALIQLFSSFSFWNPFYQALKSTCNPARETTKRRPKILGNSPAPSFPSKLWKFHLVNPKRKPPFFNLSDSLVSFLDTHLKTQSCFEGLRLTKHDQNTCINEEDLKWPYNDIYIHKLNFHCINGIKKGLRLLILVSLL